MEKIKTTESASAYDELEKMDTATILHAINSEDIGIAYAIEKKLEQIHRIIEHIWTGFSKGGRLFYVGAGTSGRLGILDASEILPTYGIKDRFIGLIAGGDKAIRNPVEFAEDNLKQVKEDIDAFSPSGNDSLLGITSSGSTPYVLSAIDYANEIGIYTAGLTNNMESALSKKAKDIIEIIVGPEFVRGSTRMKGGTSQKMVLNMISTTLMIKTGRVKGNKMINMQLSNNKLIDRGTRFIMEELNLSKEQAHALLEQHKSVEKAIHSVN